MKTWLGFFLALLIVIFLGGALLYLVMKNLAPLQEDSKQLQQSWPQ